MRIGRRARPAPDTEETPPAMEHQTRITSIAETAAASLRQHRAVEVSEEDRTFIETTPETVWPILEQLVDELKKGRRDEPFVEALAVLLRMQLEFIRYRIERGRSWAAQLANEVQGRMMELALEIDPHEWVRLVALLKEARLPVREDLLSALSDHPGLGETAASPEALRAQLSEVIEELATGAGADPFEVADVITESIGVMPADFRAFLAVEMSLSAHDHMRDVAVLMALDDDPKAREGALQAIEQMAGSDRLTGVSLRRLIAIRSWLPEAERPALDRAVKTARSRGLEPAPWPEAPAVTFRATGIDGSGAQSLFGTFQQARKSYVGSLLIKESDGIADAWIVQTRSKTEQKGMMEEVESSITTLKVPREYLDARIGYTLWRGLQAGRVAPPGLLHIAECFGAAEWRENRLDPRADTEALLAGLPSNKRTPSAVKRTLARSEQWLERHEIVQSWFEEDAEVLKLLSGLDFEDLPDAVERVHGLLETRREKWAERFYWLALWSRDGRGAPVPPWQDLLILAGELYGDRPVVEIPLMTLIATQTALALIFDEQG
jgi:hypothetical protein